MFARVLGEHKVRPYMLIAFLLQFSIRMSNVNEILEKALTLKPAQKVELIDKLLSSLDMPDKEIDELWGKEAEDRIDAYEQGKIKVVALDKVLDRYKSR